MSKINWIYFFGGSGEHYYKSEINGIRVEKHEFRGGCRYSIGNIDLAKQKFKSESELIKSLKTKNKNESH